MGAGTYYKFSPETNLSYSLVTLNCIHVIDNAIVYGRGLTEDFKIKKGSPFDPIFNWDNWKPSSYSKNPNVSDIIIKEVFNGKFDRNNPKILEDFIRQLKIDNRLPLE